MNSNSFDGYRPSSQTQVTVNNILSIRLALDQIKEPSTKIIECKDKLDTILHTFITSIHTGAK